MFGAHPGSAPARTWEPGSLMPVAEDQPKSDTARGDDDAWLRAVKNWRRLRNDVRDEDGWGLAPFAAHEFGLLTHFITLRAAVDELERHGFEISAVFPCDSARRQDIDEPVESMYMHLVACARS